LKLKYQAFITAFERNLNPNSFATTSTFANVNNNQRNDDISVFLNENSVRNRLQSLAPRPNDSYQANIHNSNPTNLRSRSNLRTGGSSFKLTLMIIMAPFVENNKVFTIDSKP
jgi:hypothetical protein